MCADKPTLGDTLKSAETVAATQEDSLADKLTREAYVFGAGMTSGFVQGAEDSWNDKLGTGVRVASAIGIGVGLAYMSKGRGVVGTLGRGAAGGLSTAFLIDLASPTRLGAIGNAWSDTWTSGDRIDTNKQLIANNLGRLSFDMALLTAAGAGSSALGRTMFKGPDVKAVKDRVRISEPDALVSGTRSVTENWWRVQRTRDSLDVPFNPNRDLIDGMHRAIYQKAQGAQANKFLEGVGVDMRRVPGFEGTRDASKIVLDAMVTTGTKTPGKVEGIIARETLPTGAYQDSRPSDLLWSLSRAHWTEFHHPGLPSNAKAFSAPIAGRAEAVPVANLPNSAKLFIVRPNEGPMYLQAEHSLPALAPYSVAVTVEQGGVRVLDSLHPGPPIKASTLSHLPPELASINGARIPITAEQAAKLGLETARFKQTTN